MNSTEQRLRDEREDILIEARRHYKNAESQDRDLSRRERARVEELLDKADKIRGQIKVEQEVEQKLEGNTGGFEDEVLTHGGPSTFADGWNQIASAIAVERKHHIELPTQSLLRSKAAPATRTKGLTPTALEDGAVRQLPGLMPLGLDRRFLYPNLPISRVTNELSVNDFRQTGSRTVTGDVERALTGAGEKAELDVAVELVSDPLKQVAITISEIPNALLDRRRASALPGL
jgi:hypothetical protein